jgi:hypothetical protein
MGNPELDRRATLGVVPVGTEEHQAREMPPE